VLAKSLLTVNYYKNESFSDRPKIEM